ncbi:TetR/AcrR family transcriptional regulator [Tsukamurella serpentis]
MSESDPVAVVDARPRRGRPRSQGLPERRREEVTRAAFAVFAEMGYERATVSEIAKRAGIGQGTLYRYVDGKRELLDLVFDHCVEQLMTAISPEAVIAATESGDREASEQTVLDLAARLFHLLDTEPEILKVVLVQAGTVDEELRYRIQGLYQSFDAMMGRALRLARERDWIITRTAHPDTETVLLGRLLPALGVPGVVMALRGESEPAVREVYVRSAVRMSGRGILADGARAALSATCPDTDPPPVAAAEPVPGRAGELLRAAVDAFTSSGYAEVGVTEITERAGVSHGTFYNYFDSKRHMLAVLVEHNTAALIRMVDEVAADLPEPLTADGLRDGIHRANLTVLSDVGERLDEFRFLLMEVPGVDSQAYGEHLQLYVTAAERCARILAPAKQAGLLDERLGIAFIAEAWVGYLLGVVAAMVNDVDVTNPAESARIVTGQLLGGARTPGAGAPGAAATPE